jgi:hypothetical protein
VIIQFTIIFNADLNETKLIFIRWMAFSLEGLRRNLDSGFLSLGISISLLNNYNPKIMKKIVIAFICLFFASCAGGGGSTHIPPKTILIGQPTILILELNAWGAGSGKLSKRYTDIQCHYRVGRDDKFIAIPMSPTAENSTLLTVQCILPPLTAKPGDKLEYYIDMKFDGVYNKRMESPVPFE